MLSDAEVAEVGDIESYLERAKELLKLAEEACTMDARAQFLILAGHWYDMAQTVEAMRVRH